MSDAVRSRPKSGRGGLYNLLAGRDVERIAALSDGIFGVAMTLLVLDIRLPEAHDVNTEAGLLAALAALAPKFSTWILSAMTLGIFWLGQEAQLSHLRSADRNLTWLHLCFLAMVTILPFATRLLADFLTFRTAVAIYWGNILLCGVILYLCWRYAERANLLKEGLEPIVSHAVVRRIVFAQTLYAIGLCVGMINPIAGVALITAIQLVYVLGIRLPGRLAH